MEQETSTQASSEQAQAPAEVAAEATQAAPEAAQGATPEAQAYTPNFKFRASGKDYEFDEWIRPVVKDADTEKKLRDMYEKAYGLPSVKKGYEELEKKYKTTDGEYSALKGDIEKVIALRDKDLGKFLETFGLNDEKVFQYVMDRLNYQQMPQEQRQVLEARKAAEERAASLESQVQTQQEQFQQYMAQNRASELQSVLERPDIKAAAEAFDSRVGKPGQFYAEVVRRGQMAAQFEGRDISAQEAVSQVLSVIGAQGGNGAVAAQQAQSQKPPVIPAVAGRASSPAFKPPKSIDDLKRLAKAGQG